MRAGQEALSPLSDRDLRLGDLMFTRLCFIAALVLAASICFAQQGSQNSSTRTPIFRTIDFPGALDTAADGVNNLGEIVGCYLDTQGNFHGFTFVNGQIHRFDYPKSAFNGAYGINDSGVIVGTFSTSIQQSYESSNGTFQVIPIFQSFASDINNSGTIVGSYYDVCCMLHGYIYSGGQFTYVDYPGAASTFLDGINSAGIASGFSEDASNVRHGFTWTNGTFTSIDVPGAISTSALRINAANVVVGYYKDTSSVYHGFALENGIYTTIDFPGAAGTQIFGINDHGVLVGNYTDSNGTMHGFVAHR